MNRVFDYFMNELTGKNFAGAELSTLLEQKITNYYTKLQVDELAVNLIV